MAKTRRNWLDRHAIGPRLVSAVILIHGAMLLTLFVTKPWILPTRVKHLELVWAWMREPIFYPLAAVVFLAPPVTLAALCIRGIHRLWLVGSWLGFVVLIQLFYHDRMVTMLRSFYWAMTR